MNKHCLLILFFFFCHCSTFFAQVSHGGSPLFLENSLFRNSNGLNFVEMPAFDLDSVLQADELNKQNMRGSYQFAHKFYTRIEKGLQGNIQIMPDGTKVWQIGIHSKGAFSINLLFTKYHLPEGGKLFIYNADRSHVIGSFDHRNNSEEKILPIRPIAGDSIIIEYSEPANAAFEGELVIGEVNHDYRDILRLGNDEPKGDPANSSCMIDVVCDAADADDTIIRSTVLLVINGNTACSGSLINNTANDEKPYLLTAVHCLNPDIEKGLFKDMNHYIARAGTIVTFFNYNRPACGTTIRGTEEMSVAASDVKVIIEKKDIALLELREKPPVHYNAYYAGWNVSSQANNPPYTNLHHPQWSVKKYGVANKNLTLLSNFINPFDANTHWKVDGWDVGSTDFGSSGSPLFDRNNQIVGLLTTGESYCSGGNSNNAPDYFAALYAGWEQADPTNQLKTYLDPNNTGKQQQEGYDPNVSNPLVRISNANYNHGDELVTYQLNAPYSGLVFGKSSLNTTEFAEEFNLDKTSEVLGIYLMIPPMPFPYTSGVEIEIYSGTSSPETLLASKPFIPQYLNYNGNFNPTNKNTSSPTETFVLFDNPVNVQKKFFVAYKLNTDNPFSVYNTEFSSQKANAAWLKHESQWVRATEYAPFPCTTSLALQPLIRYTNGSAIPEIENKEKGAIRYDRNSNQLFLPFESTGSGDVFVYSVSGQLLEHLTFSTGEKSMKLSTMPKGTIGIVKFIYKEEVFSGKIIY